MSTNADFLLQALAQDPTGASAGLSRRACPPGHVVDVPGAGPLYWISEGAPSGDTMVAARARSTTSGLWPLLVDGGGTYTRYEQGPDGSQERLAHWFGEGRPSKDPSGTDPDRWLAEQWQSLIRENEEYYEPDERVSSLAPTGTTWPGLAPAAAFPAVVADACASRLTAFLLRSGWLQEPRMALVPAATGSDALIAARCTLAENDDLAGHAAVLRSWEHRFGARVIAVRSDTLFVSVAAAPTERSAAAHIACEHFAFAPDNVQQNADSFPEYVDELIGSNLWGFWWD